MEYLEKLDWSLVWGVIKDTIVPHSATLIFNTILFLIVGFFLSIIYTIILSKKKVLKRKSKYYNWAVKLYIPILLCAFLYIFGQVGFIRGVYKILHKEKEPIVSNVYFITLSFIFRSEENKNTFVKELQASAEYAKDGSDYLVELLKVTSTNYNSGISLIDRGKNKISVYLIEKYGDDIYKTCLYAMLNLAGGKVHADINESMSYDEFSAAMDFLLDVGYKEIEVAVQDKLMTWLTSFLDSQYHSMVKSLFIILFIIMSIPVIEFFIYKKWIEPGLIKKEIKN
ncbi:hypothetical protein [Aquimarina algiphila]|uniref:hypothetical protein n=1 Tax=Aquimarina algiphila TaxID=2047982 RepID=UPI002493725B|nr:hypothetical protein [Aquimarina algiphila]